MEIGIQGRYTQVVTQELLATAVGSGNVQVLATPMVLAGMEHAASQSVLPYLQEGQTTVGIHASFAHEAATPLGMQVRYMSTLTEISEDGKRLTFAIEAFDEVGRIASGTHVRAIVNHARFEERAQNKGK